MNITKGTRRALLAGARASWEKVIGEDVAAGEALLWYKFDEAAGAVLNYGTLGAGVNGTNNGCLVQQSGPLGPQHAYDWDTVGDNVSVPDNAAWDTAAFTIMALCRPRSMGEGPNLGHVWAIKDSTRCYHSTTLAWLTFQINQVTTDAQAAGTFATAFDTVSYYLVICMYQQGQLPRLYRVKSGSKVLEENSYSSVQTAGVGNYVPPAAAWRIGNRPAGSRRFDGLHDEFVYLNVARTAAQLQRYANVA